MIAIVDYGLGNLMSISKAIEYLGYDVSIVKTPENMNEVSHIVLPGVGAFRDAINLIDSRGWREPLLSWIENGRPLLGICLGMQVLFDCSHEGGLFKGLGVFKGEVVRFPEGLRVPHMGWNSVEIKKQSPLLNGIKDNAYFYFVHSFYADTQDAIAFTEYGSRFASVVGMENCYGVQFHPEKSADAGLRLLQNFLEIG